MCHSAHVCSDKVEDRKIAYSLSTLIHSFLRNKSAPLCTSCRVGAFIKKAFYSRVIIINLHPLKHIAAMPLKSRCNKEYR